MRNTTTRRGLARNLGGWGIAVAVLPLFAGACSAGESAQSEGPVTIRISHDEPAHMLTHRLLEEMATTVDERTDGAVTFEVSPAAQLSGGNIETMIQQTQGGARLDAALIASGIYSNFDSAVDIFSLPFLSRDIDDLHTLANSEIGEEVAARTEQTGLTTRDIWVRDLRQWVNGTRPIRTPADMQGLTFRVPEFPLWVKAFEAVGAAATPMPFGEAFTAVQTGAIDGAERPTEFLVGEGWEDVADHVTMANYAGDVLLFSFNTDFWNSLPADVQDILDEEIAAMADRKFEEEKSQRDDFVDQLASSGMSVHELTADEYAAFREQMGTVWDEWEEQGRLPDGWLDQAVDLVGKD